MDAIEPLQTRDPDELLRSWSQPEESSLLGRVLADTEALATAVTSVPPAFVHGDCHTETS